MKRTIFLLFALLSICSLASYHDNKTYANQEIVERSAINKYVADSAVSVTSEETFAAQGYTTNMQRNEFILISNSGVYMQVIRNGMGEKIKNDETVDVLCRFKEHNLMTDSLQLSNDVSFYLAVVDKMKVRNTNGTSTASSVKGKGVMSSAFNTTEVPAGWLVLFNYIHVGGPIEEGDEIAKVRLIVPHTNGHDYARQSVYPCLYDITYQRGR